MYGELVYGDPGTINDGIVQKLDCNIVLGVLVNEEDPINCHPLTGW